MASEIRPGSTAASAQVPQLISTLAVCRARTVTNVLGAHEVKNIAEVMVLPANAVLMR